MVGLLLLLMTDADRMDLTSAQQRHATIRVFLDCNRCDEDYMRREVTFIDYVRNREDADVHVLITTQDTGGGGVQFTLKFIGLAGFQGVEQTLTYNSPATATGDETRAGLLEVFKLGLVRYASESTAGERLRVTYNKPDDKTAAAAGRHDPWDYWVFRINVGGDFNGEQSSTSRAVRASCSANRTTDDWRLGFNANANYRDSTFVLEDASKILSVSRNTNVNGLAVKSLTPHWSFGVVGNVSSSTFQNYALNARIAAGPEYDIFPYSESTRRILTIQYTVGYDIAHYREITVYDKLRERLLDHRAETDLNFRQPWGSASVAFVFSQYLTQPSKYSLAAFGGGNIRIVKGLSFNAFGEFSRPHDQIFLPRGEASTEEILLRQRQLATGYQYFVNFGISYQFGSIFNNIVNPRFGGAGGFDF